jgi:hypothetical protein
LDAARMGDTARLSFKGFALKAIIPEPALDQEA